MVSPNTTAKTILLIDDDINIRLVIKKLLHSTLINSQIYTSDKGPEGLGLAYILKPDIIILDTTLPKYSGRELIEFIVTNNVFQNTKVIVLHEDNNIEDLKKLNNNYVVLSKKSREFPSSLIDSVKESIEHKPDGRFHKLTFRLGRRAITFANLSDIEVQATNTSKNIFVKLLNTFTFFINQVRTSINLALFLIVVGRPTREENISPDKQELQVYRSRVYPAYAFLAATFIIILLQLAGLVGSFLGSGLFFSTPVRAAAKVWDGGGTTNNWSDCVNWDLNVCPAAADTVTFNGTSVKNVTVDATFAGTVGSITIAAGYTGTMTVARSLTITGLYSQAAGTFNGAGQTISVGTTFTLSAGIFTSTSATLSITGTVSITGTPTFTHNSGTVNFTGGTATLGCNNVTFNLVTFTGQSNTKTVNSDCSLPLGASPTIPLSIVLNGTLSGTGTVTLSAGTITFNSGSVFSGFSGFTAVGLGGIVVAGGTINFGTYNPVSMGNFTVSSGTFTAPSGTMTVTSAFVISGTGVYTHNSGTINASGGTNVSCNNQTINIVTFASGGSINNCTASLGNNPSFGNSMQFNSSTVSGSGTITMVQNSFTINTGNTFTGFSGYDGATSFFTIAGSTIDFGTFSTFNTQSFTLSSGSFTAPSGTWTTGNNFSISGGTTFTSNGGTINFNGTATTISGTITCNSATFSSVNFTASVGKITNVSSGCDLPIGTNPSIVGTINLTGTLTGTGTINDSTFSLTLNSGYALAGFTGLTGTVNSLTIAGATANFSTYNPLTLGGSFSITSGSFTAPSGTMIVGANFSITSGTFTHNSGIVNFTGGIGSLNCLSQAFNSVNFSGQTDVKTVNSGCSLPLGANPTIPNGITLSGTLTGSGTITNTTGTFTVNTGYALTGFTGLTGTSNALIVAATTANFGSFNPLTLGSTFTLTSGTFTAPSTTMIIGGDFTYTAGTFTHNSGTVNFTGSTATLSCGSQAFSSVNFSGQTGVKTVNSNCTLPLGASPTIPNGITLSGTLSGTGTITNTTGTLTLNSTAALTGFSGFTGTSNALTIAGATISFSGYSPAVVSGNFTISSGTFTAPSGTLQIGGDYAISGTFTHNNGTVSLTGGSSAISCGGQSLRNLTINTSGTKTFSAACTMTSAFTLVAGTVIAPSATLTVSGDFTLSSGTTFTHNSGTILFNGAGVSSCNNTTFNLVSITTIIGNRTVNSDCSLPLGASPSVGNVILNGTLSGSGTYTGTGNTLTFNSSTAALSGFSGMNFPGTITVQGSANVSFGSYSPASTAHFVLSSGTFTAPSGTLTVNINFTISGGTFTHNSGTVNFTSSNSAVIACNNASFNLVSFSGQSAVKTINSDCSLPLGSSPTIPNGIILNGTLSGSGTLTHTTGTLTLNTGAVLSGFSGLTGTTNALTVAGATANFGSYSPFVLNGALSITSGSLTAPNSADFNNNITVSSGGTFNAPSGTMNVAGVFSTFTGSTFNANSGTIILDTTVASTGFNCGPANLNSVQVLATGSGSYIMTSSCTVNNFTMTSGTWLNPSGSTNLNINGDFAENAATTFGGSFLQVIFTGTGLQNISKTAGTFSSLFFVANSGIAQLTTAFVVTTAQCQVQGGGSIFYTNGFAFTCAGGFTIFSGGTIQMQGAETVTAPTLNSGSTVQFVGNGNAGVNTYTIAAWTYTNATLIINSTDGLTDTFTFNSNITVVTLTLTAGTVVKGVSQTTMSVTTISIAGATWTPGAITLSFGFLNCSAGIMANGAGPTTMSGAFLNINGCDFRASTGTTNLSSDFTFTSGSFTHNSGIIAFNGSGAQNISCGTAVLNTVNFTVGGTKTFTQDCSVGAMNGTLGTVNATGTVNLTAAGLITVGGATWSTGFTTITANAGITCTTGSMNNGSETIDVNGTLTINGCTFTSTSGTMTISTNFTKTTGTFTGGSGTVTFDGGTQTVTCGSATFNTVNFTTSGSKTLSGTCTTGDLNMNAGTIGMAVTSPWTVNGLLTVNGAAFTPGANTINANGGLTCTSGSVTGGTAVLNIATFLVNGCTFTAPSVAMGVSGDFTYSSGTFTHNSGTVNIDGDTQIVTCGTTTLNTLSFITPGNKTFSGDCTAAAINLKSGTIGTTGSPNITASGLITVGGGNWTVGTAGGTARYYVKTILSGTKTYSWGGFIAAATNTMSIYDFSTDAWSSGATGGTARWAYTAQEYNGKIYYLDGCTDGSCAAPLNTIDIYDIAGNSWSTGTAGGTARGLPVSALYNGKIYVWGGFTGATYLNTLSIYDIAGNSWSTATAGGTARWLAGSALSNGKIYIWGGTNGANVNALDIYDIAGNSWSTGTNGGTSRRAPSTTLYNGRIYFTGGFIAAATNTTDVYDIANDSWSVGTTGGVARYGMGNVLYNGYVYDFFGNGGAGAINTVDIYALDADFTTSTATINANAGLTCSGGSMDATSATTTAITTLTISGCNFTAPTGTMTISTNYTKTTGNFVHSSGTVTLNGGTQAIACGGSEFNIFNITTAGTKTLSNTCTTGVTNMTAGTVNMAVTSPWTYNGLLTINGATFSPVANTVTATAGITCSSGTLTGGTATFTVTGTFLISGCAYTNGGNTITASSGVTCSGGTVAGAAAALNINGDLTISGCAFTSTSVSLLLSGNFTFSSGTFTHNSGTVNLDGDTQVLTCGTATLNTLTFSTSGNKTISGNCNAAAVNMNSGTIGTSGSPTINSTGLFTVAGGAWSAGTAGGAVRSFVSGVQYNGKIYVYGGNVGGSVVNTMDIFDIATSTWSTGTAGGTAKRNYSVVEHNGKLYYWGGCNGACSASFNALDIYDIAGNSWSTGATGGTARNSHIGVTDGTKMYIITGFVTGVGFANSVDIYDFTGNSWTTGTAGGVAKSNAAGVYFNGNIYSWSGTTGGAGLNTMDIYNISGNSWSTGTAGGTARLTASLVVFGGKMWGWGGCTDASCTVFTTVTDVYDFTTNTWSTGISGGSSRRNFADVVYNNKRYITGDATMNVFDWGANFTTGTAALAMSGGLTCSSGSLDSSSATSLVVAAYTISGCSFDAPTSGTFQVSGNYAFTGGQIHHNSGTAVFTGGVTTVNSGCATVTTCAPAFYNLTINKTLNTDTLTLLTNSIRTANTLTITKGTLSQAALLNVRADGATAVSVASNGSWTNTATGDISLGGSVVNSGTMTLQGTTSACAAEADAISITSTSAGVQRAWSGTGTFAFNDLTVQDQGGTAGIAARSSTSVSGNGTNWFFVGCTATAPNTPTSLAQKKSDNTTVISTGAWTNETIVKFSATLSDTDNPDGLAVCIEAKPIGVSFTNTEDGCSSYVSYTGTGVAATYTPPSTLADSTYHWQAKTKDAGGLSSAWVSFGANAESATDFALDSTAPTGGTVFDGTGVGVDVTFNSGSLSSLSANWSGIDASISGLSSYDYSIGTTIGGTDILNWTANSTTTSATATGLTLKTLTLYYFNVRTNDVAGNSSVISSNGQYVTPSISFSVSSNTITFDNLNNTNSYSSTKTTTLTTSTNAFQGYVVKVYKSDLLRSILNPLNTINDFSAGSYASPAAWPGGTYGFGYTSNDSSLISGGNKFTNSPCLGGGNAPCYAPFSSSAPGDIVADNGSTVTGTPISGEVFTITYKVQVPNTQQAGTYVTNLIYSIVSHY